MECINHERCDPNVYWEIRKVIDDSKHDNKTGCLNHALKVPEERKYLDYQNITKLTKAFYKENHLVLTFMVYAFHRVNVSLIRCILIVHLLLQCFGWAWYLANDMQFYIIAPAILFTAYR